MLLLRAVSFNLRGLTHSTEFIGILAPRSPAAPVLRLSCGPQNATKGLKLILRAGAGCEAGPDCGSAYLFLKPPTRASGGGEMTARIDHRTDLDLIEG